MVIGTGVDIVQVERVAALLREHPDRRTRLFTRAEIEYCQVRRDPEIHFAGRFAAKEAVLKCLGTGWRGGITWNDIETTCDALGAPRVGLTGEAAAIARRRGIARIELSISHTRTTAIAFAVASAASAAAEGDQQ